MPDKNSTRKTGKDLTGQSQHGLIPPKITAPRPTRLYPRQRLFELFGRRREAHGITWVSTPAGAGKTSLAASYLASYTLPTLWYQVDAGDGDIASFFFYLGLAVARIAPPPEPPMLVLAPEYMGDVPTFARNYFREFYRRLPPGCVIVLDNYQDAPPQSPLHAILPVALHELPQGMGFVVLSREEPPATLARLRLSGEITCIDATQMQLTVEESQGVSTVRLGAVAPDHAMLRQLHERTHGWVAGLVLLLEQTRTGGVLNPAQIPVGRELLFDYFAGEVFAQFTAAEQDFLLKTALFARISASAAHELSGNPRAATILDGLARHNYFTVRHAENYEYHPLFREFLLARLQRGYTSEELAALRRRAAALAEASGNAEDAVQLWIGQCVEGVESVLVSRGASSARTGTRPVACRLDRFGADCVTGAGSVATLLARTGTPAVRTARGACAFRKCAHPFRSAGRAHQRLARLGQHCGCGVTRGPELRRTRPLDRNVFPHRRR